MKSDDINVLNYFLKDSTPTEQIIARDGNEDLLSKRRFTMLSDSEERLINEEMDNEEIIEGFRKNLINENDV